LTALKPINVAEGLSVTFTPMPKYEVPSAKEELVSMGAAKAFETIGTEAANAVKAKEAKRLADKEKTDERTFQATQKGLDRGNALEIAKQRGYKTDEEKEIERLRTEVLRKQTEKEPGKAEIKSRPAGSLQNIPTPAPTQTPSPNADILETPPLSGKTTSFTVPPPPLVDIPVFEEPLPPAIATSPVEQLPSAIATAPVEPIPLVLTPEQISLIQNPPPENISASAGAAIAPPAITPQVVTAPTPTPAQFKATPQNLANLAQPTWQEKALSGRESMIAKAESQPAPAPVAEVPVEKKPITKTDIAKMAGEYLNLPYDSFSDALIAQQQLKELLPDYKEAVIEDFKDPKTNAIKFQVKPPQPKEVKEKEKAKLLQTQITKLENINAAQTTLNEINSVLKEVGNTKGPVVGRVRQLLGGVGYDKLAIRLNNLVDSLTPGLARGVFGEVGVLTDDDVRRYKALIPNITRNPEVADAIMKDLMSTLNSRRQISIDVWDKAGFDVDNFKEKKPEKNIQIEKEVSDLAEKMKNIPASQVNTPEAQSLIKQYKLKKSQLQ
jgi:hypothetical protein